ncbi:hypothetical protein TSUD_114430 [Trifolium subterraneum]|uniref:Beta-ketoacyl-[acyl-carrier-protein] synthase III C-terminal domain-containing protein n=1 Tax=Trifolium subterraneum TaxID=3900 RepID=A0A2Z6MCX8_TRISU|nr:hypothetical protein TSUD_114430 [Trifolium subterraneum]
MNTEQLFPEFSPISPFQQEILRRMRFMPDDPFPAFIISTYRHHHDDTQVVTPSNQHIDIASSSSSPPVFFLVDLQGVVHAPMDEIYLLSAANNVDVSHCFLNTANEEIPEDETFQSMDFGNVDITLRKLQIKMVVSSSKNQKSQLTIDDELNLVLSGADALSRYVYWTDSGTCILFVDAAGAVVVQSLYSCILMNGKDVFGFVVRCVPQSIENALEKADLPATSIGWLLLHQANQRIIDAVATRLEIPSERVISNLANYGNTSTASIPLALDEAVRSGKV